jgi:acyl dehydratase
MSAELDTSDLDRYVGVPFLDRKLKDPISVLDIRRWVHAFDNPNPLHFDDDYAATTRFGGIIAPQSFLVGAGDGAGASPARQGNIPGSHLLFGGDEWWFLGPRILPGDRMSVECMFMDYKVRDTSFAGPTAICRGDSTYVNQRGEFVGKQRSTVIRYRPELARERMSNEPEKEWEWTDDRMDELTEQRVAYVKDLRSNPARQWNGIKVGDELPRRPHGPHSIASFTGEQRSRPGIAWGATQYLSRRGRVSGDGAGWIPEMNWDLDRAQIDPAAVDGLFEGPSRGHIQERYAKVIGMPKPYGYGASMGAWLLDYVANWAGDNALIVHSDARYFAPVFAGDVSLFTGEVVDKREDTELADREAVVEVKMEDQFGKRIAGATMSVAFE